MWEGTRDSRGCFVAGTTRPLADRFWKKVDKRGSDECWPWTASLTAQGYAQISRDGKPTRGYLVVLEMFGRPVPAGSHVHHVCRNRACVNPAHLEIVAGQAEHSARHLRGCAKHGEAEMRRTRSGKNAGMRYCAACNREKMRRYRRGPDPRLDALLEDEAA